MSLPRRSSGSGGKRLPDRIADDNQPAGHAETGLHRSHSKASEARSSTSSSANRVWLLTCLPIIKLRVPAMDRRSHRGSGRAGYLLKDRRPARRVKKQIVAIEQRRKELFSEIIRTVATPRCNSSFRCAASGARQQRCWRHKALFGHLRDRRVVAPYAGLTGRYTGSERVQTTRKGSPSLVRNVLRSLIKHGHGPAVLRPARNVVAYRNWPLLPIRDRAHALI